MSPPLPALETYVYAGIASFASPGKRGADGTAETTKRATADGNYEVITLRPDGGASGMFFSVRRDEAPEFSETDAACWQWREVSGSTPPYKLELRIGGGRLEFVRAQRELRQRVKNDKLLTESVYEQVDNPSAQPSCSSSGDPAQLFAGRTEPRVAFAALRERGMRGLVIGREGSAEAVEIRVDGPQLRWTRERGCWSSEGARVRVTFGAQPEVYEVAEDVLRLTGGDPSRASAYRRAR